MEKRAADEDLLTKVIVAVLGIKAFLVLAHCPSSPSSTSVAAPEPSTTPTAIAEATPESTPEPSATAASTSVEPPTNVVSAITGNRRSGGALIVLGTLTNTSAVAAKIRSIDSRGFNANRTMVVRGSDYTIVHNDLAPGETVNFKVALKDTTKQVKFVEVIPTWSPSTVR